MANINAEVTFLRNFGKRFKRKETYLAALKDMLDEGMITKKAYEIIKNEKVSKNSMIKPNKIVKEATKVLNDPCSHNIVWHSPCSTVTASPCDNGGRTC